MKKYTFILFSMFFSVLLTSCNSDSNDDDVPVNPKPSITKEMIIGEWKSIASCSNGSIWNYGAYENTNHVYIFKSDATYQYLWNKQKTSSLDENGIYTVKEYGNLLKLSLKTSITSLFTDDYTAYFYNNNSNKLVLEDRDSKRLLEKQ